MISLSPLSQIRPIPKYNILLYCSYMNTKLVAVDIKSGSSLPSLTTVLPQGDPSRDYNITIQVAIHDSLGATSHDIKFVTV